MTEHLDPLDPEIEALLDAERARPPAPPHVGARVLARVTATVGSGGGGSPPGGTPPAGGGGLLLKPILLGAALGGAVALGIVARPAPAPSPISAVTATAAIAVPASTTHEPLTVAPKAREAERPAPPPPPVTAPREAHEDPVGMGGEPPAQPVPGERDESLAPERRLLDEARWALGDGRSAAAFDALDRHAREFPRGRLGEEREALWIRALARAGRLDEARDRASRFFASHPNSLLRPALEETVGPIP